jgi:hypothetical protein
MLFGCRIIFLMVWCKDGGEVGVEGCGRLSVHDGFWDSPLFGGVWCKCTCVGSCLIRITSMHDMNSIRMFEDDVMWLEHSHVIEGVV